MYIDSSNHFVVSSMIFFLVNFYLFCFNMELEVFFVNYFVVQWRLSSTIALYLFGFLYERLFKENNFVSYGSK